MKNYGIILSEKKKTRINAFLSQVYILKLHRIEKIGIEKNERDLKC